MNPDRSTINDFWIDYGKHHLSKNNLVYLKEMTLLLKNFLLEHFDSKEALSQVVGKLHDVLARCDEIDYSDTPTIAAYTMLHFLDRFRRFQVSYGYLLGKRLLPLPKYPMNFLDVGTGPASSIFALSDIYQFVPELIKKEEQLADRCQPFNTDYVEQSRAFRDWLHHFTEHVNGNNKIEHYWHVPYHHGSFMNFNELDLQKESRVRFDPWSGQHYKNTYRYNIITFSNFLTKTDQVTSLHDELRSAAYSLRNHGLLVVVGGRFDKYEGIYKELDSILTKKIYLKNKTVGRCSRILSKTLKYSTNNEAGSLIESYFSFLLGMFAKHDLLDQIPSDILKSLEREAKGKARPTKWRITVYKMKHHPKRKPFKRGM